MKLLLTSGGLQNDTIKSAAAEMLGKPFGESNLCYIPTAAVAEGGDHFWMIDSLLGVHGLGWKEFDVLELSGLPKDEIVRRLDHADVIYAEGGNLYYLMKQIEDRELSDTLRQMLETKLYIGVSAGSMIFSKYHSKEVVDQFGETDDAKIGITESPLPLVDFYLKPHLDNKLFGGRTKAWAKEIADKVDFPIYFIDDQTAIKIVDGKLEVISEGEWLVFNND